LTPQTSPHAPHLRNRRILFEVLEDFDAGRAFPIQGEPEKLRIIEDNHLLRRYRVGTLFLSLGNYFVVLKNQLAVRIEKSVVGQSFPGPIH
jgi:hypothetical protein